MTDRFLSTLGLCRRAGMLISGFDAVCDEIKKPKNSKNRVYGVITASDISGKTLKEVKFVCDRYGVRLYSASANMEEIKSVLGKRTGIIAILDEGLFVSLSS